MARQALGVASSPQANWWDASRSVNVATTSSDTEPRTTRWSGGTSNGSHGLPCADAPTYTPVSRDPLVDNDPWNQSIGGPSAGMTLGNTNAGGPTRDGAQWNTQNSAGWPNRGGAQQDTQRSADWPYTYDSTDGYGREWYNWNDEWRK